MKILNTKPINDGFHMPGEFEPHHGCILIWPVRPGSWPHGAKEAKETFTEIAEAISESEDVYMLCSSFDVKRVGQIFLANDRVHVIPIETDDAWARDVGPTFVVNNEAGEIRGINWQFNAWGGDYDGLYPDWEKDDMCAYEFCKELDCDIYDARHFVLEGGSIHSDGEGTVIVTEACLLSKGRNPDMTKEEIENELKTYLNAKKVIWLKRGIYNDETNEHVDNICAFVKPGEVVLAWTDDENDPQYELSKSCLDILEQETDAMGRKIIVHKLPIPKVPVTITAEELSGFTFEDGEDEREVGERLAASYVNFYISNNGIILPQFGDENDKVAASTLAKLFPDRKIYPIYARPIIVGGGNIHCITQQIPEGI